MAEDPFFEFLSCLGLLGFNRKEDGLSLWFGFYINDMLKIFHVKEPVTILFEGESEFY